MWTVENLILFRKILLYHHLMTLPSESLAREIAERQIVLNWPGIATQMYQLLESWNIMNVQSYTKKQFKVMIKRKLSMKSKKDLFSMSQNYKKINLKNYEGDLKMEDYLKNLNLESGRMIFRKNASLIKTVMMNFKSVKKYKSLRYICQDCIQMNPPVSHLDNQETLLSECLGNADLRIDLNLMDDNQLVKYLKRVIDRRIQRYGG